MKIKLIKGYDGNDAGAAIDIDTKKADRLVKRGIAVPVKAEKPSDPGDIVKVSKKKAK